MTAEATTQDLHYQGHDDTQIRRVALFGLSVLLVVLLVLAVSSWATDTMASGQSVKSQTERPKGGLPGAHEAKPDSADSSDLEPNSAEPEVMREALAFPSKLAEPDIRPEVESTIAAVAAEHLQQAGSLAKTAFPMPEHSESRDEASPHGPTHRALAAMQPSSSSVVELEKTLSDTSSAPVAPVGHAGPFMLQVMSYRNALEARTFARILRARGHKGFVQAAEVRDRGTYWRVRIGPFTSKWQAQTYLTSFERKEKLGAHVVSKND